MLGLLAGVLVALSLAGTAQAKTPCGKQVFLDWYDNGRIDHLYPLHCYEDALNAIPSDIRDYSDAGDVINRALSAALRGKLAPGGPDPTPGNGTNRQTTGSSGGSGSSADGTQAAGNVSSSGASAVPVPLLVLGGMALALLAAGGLGYLSRRRKAAEAEEPGDVADDEEDDGGLH